MTRNSVVVTLLAWAASRAIIGVAFALAAPHGVVAALTNWDGAWYGSVASHGYEFAPDGAQHNVAFFPLFPLIARLVMLAGAPWPIAAAITSNVAFIGALLLLFAYARERLGEAGARWVVAATCFFPLSFFFSVAYSESLFLLLTALALFAYERGHFALSGIAAAGAALTRPFGFALACALVIAALVQRRGPRAIALCAIGLAGAALFPLYCWIHFGDPIAFLHAASTWRHVGFDASGWQGMWRGAYTYGYAHDRLTVLLLVFTIFATAAFRKTLGIPGVLYVALALALIVAAGSPLSLDRYLFVLIPVLLAIGDVLKRLHVAGYLVLAALAWLLAIASATFAQGLWVA